MNETPLNWVIVVIIAILGGIIGTILAHIFIT